MRLSDRLAASQTVFLVLLDGVGTCQLAAHCPDGALAEHQQGTLTSVFPSSTAPAITSLLTASPPATHANPAWYAHQPEIDRVVRTLPMNVRGYPQEAVPEDLWSWYGWTARAAEGAERVALQPAAIFDSSYSRRALRGCQRIGYEAPFELVPLMAELARKPAPEGRFVYVYLPQFDSTAHDFGWQSEQARDCLVGFDEWFQACLTALSDLNALMVVLADHGFIDIAPACQHRLDDYPALQASLISPLAGEPRTVFCRVAPENERTFLRAFQTSHLASVSHCVRTHDLASAGWFGPSPQPELIARCGSHIVLMHDGHTLTDCMAHERPMSFIGMHGGMATDEMQVPLILAGVN